MDIPGSIVFASSPAEPISMMSDPTFSSPGISRSQLGCQTFQKMRKISHWIFTGQNKEKILPDCRKLEILDQQRRKSLVKMGMRVIYSIQ
jgi:hypothetical protein